ncbi:C-C motif chemokine 28-like [Coregonus clupeaformis]|uniref:C-C motif chemokine 28-like n=1 Tax=Coregonus clupeaformis TaxID=59861 RepID=UPI001BE0CFA5|nr:C-C motif chemokine 28-like [Coregonus clupeaformis]
MDLRVMAMLLFLCALAITTTEGGIPKCCVKASMDIPTYLLRKVERAEMQRNNGACEINALVLHVQGKRLCAHPKVKRKLKRVQRRKGGKQTGQ